MMSAKNNSGIEGIKFFQELYIYNLFVRLNYTVTECHGCKRNIKTKTSETFAAAIFAGTYVTCVVCLNRLKNRCDEVFRNHQASCSGQLDGTPNKYPDNVPY